MTGYDYRGHRNFRKLIKERSKMRKKKKKEKKKIYVSRWTTKKVLKKDREKK